MAHVVLVVVPYFRGNDAPDDEVHTRDDEHTDASSGLMLHFSL